MARSVYIRRFLACLLCCVLAFHSALPVARAAEPVSASLAIAGGAIALAGVSGAAITNTIGPQVAAIVGTTMEGLGTSVYTAESSAKTKTQFIMEKIAVWCYQAGKAKEDFYKTVAQGISVAANGTIQLSKDAATQISQFISWIYTQGSDVVVPEVVVSGSTFNFGGYSLPVSPVTIPYTEGSTDFLLNFTADKTIAICFALRTSGGVTYLQPCFIRPASAGKRVTWTRYNNSTGVSSDGYADLTLSTSYVRYGYTSIGYIKPESVPANYPVFNSVSDFYSYASSINVPWSTEDAVPGQDVFVGTGEEWAENKDLLNPAGDDVVTLSPDLLGGLVAQLEQGQVATMGINTYLDSLVSAFDGLKAQVAELTDAVTGTSTAVAVPDTVTTEVSVDPVAPGVVPVVEPVELNPDGTIESFSFPLDEIFPFCIPFDVAAALSLFDVPAEAPALHVHWDLPYNIVFDFDLDLSAYDDIAALLRIMETILFCVGLAVATRGIFLRS